MIHWSIRLPKYRDGFVWFYHQDVTQIVKALVECYRNKGQMNSALKMTVYVISLLLEHDVSANSKSIVGLSESILLRQRSFENGSSESQESSSRPLPLSLTHELVMNAEAAKTLDCERASELLCIFEKEISTCGDLASMKIPHQQTIALLENFACQVRYTYLCILLFLPLYCSLPTNWKDSLLPTDSTPWRYEPSLHNIADYRLIITRVNVLWVSSSVICRICPVQPKLWKSVWGRSMSQLRLICWFVPVSAAKYGKYRFLWIKRSKKGTCTIHISLWINTRNSNGLREANEHVDSALCTVLRIISASNAEANSLDDDKFSIAVYLCLACCDTAYFMDLTRLQASFVRCCIELSRFVVWGKTAFFFWWFY